MAFRAHLDRLAGPPVVGFPALNSAGHLSRLGVLPDDATRTAAPAEPHSAAWRLCTPQDGDPLESYEEYFTRFLDEVDTSRTAALVADCWGRAARSPDGNRATC